MLDLHFSTSGKQPASVLTHLRTSLTTAKLSFLAYVDPARVPLFLACGPSLNLTTSSVETESFFRALFLSALPDLDDSDLYTPEQCRVALLLRVSGGEGREWGVTELVVYGAVSLPNPKEKKGNMTPPTSSPPPDSPESSESPEPPIRVTVHALPLSSRHGFNTFIPAAKSAPVPVSVDATPAAAVFIAPDPQEILNPFITQSAKKRRADVLDTAIEKRKKPRKNAATAAGTTAATRQPPPKMAPLGVSSANKLNAKLLADGAVSGRAAGARSSKTPATTALAKIKIKTEAGADEYGLPTPPALPRRNSSALVSTKLGGDKEKQEKVQAQVQAQRARSTSMAIPTLQQLRAKTPKPDPSSPEARNRDALNKTIVSTMKTYGLRDPLQDRKRPSLTSSSSTSSTSNSTAVAALDEKNDAAAALEQQREEWKLVFHHTAVAATFALRAEMANEKLDPARVKSVVDGLLVVFCGGRVYGTAAALNGGGGGAGRRRSSGGGGVPLPPSMTSAKGGELVKVYEDTE